MFERVINSAFDQKLAPGALSIDILDIIVNHIKDKAARNKFHNFVHQPSDLYKLDTSFIHRAEEHTVILILHVPFVETKNFFPSTSLFLSLSTSTSLQTSPSFRTSANLTSSLSATPRFSRCFLHQI
jgi:hypothetical protein